MNKRFLKVILPIASILFFVAVMYIVLGTYGVDYTEGPVGGNGLITVPQDSEGTPIPSPMPTDK